MPPSKLYRLNNNGLLGRIRDDAAGFRTLADQMRQAGAQTSWIDDPTERQQLARTIMNADKMQFENAAFLRELAAWIRPPQTSARDGIPASTT